MKQIGRYEPGTYKALVPRRLRATASQQWVPALVQSHTMHEGAKQRLLCIVNGHVVPIADWWPALYPIEADEYREMIGEHE